MDINEKTSANLTTNAHLIFDGIQNSCENSRYVRPNYIVQMANSSQYLSMSLIESFVGYYYALWWI